MNRNRPYLVGLVGAGVDPSLTPPLHMAEAAAQGIPYLYRPIDLTRLGLDAASLPEILDWAERLGFDALNITHPCKQAVVPLLDRVDPTAAALGAVNTVLLGPDARVGANTDGSGFERAFRDGLPGAALDRVVQIGAGGAGSAVADALLRLGARRLAIVDLDADRAGRLAASLAERHGVEVLAAAPGALAAELAAADGAVNCSPVGMHDRPGSPIPRELLRPGMWVSDIVYLPLETELLRDARAAGCRTLAGGAMAVAQAASAFALITGATPDLERMTRSFRSLVDDDAAETPRRDHA